MASTIASTRWTSGLPPATPPAGMALYHLPTGTYETRAAFAVQGGSFTDKRQFAASAVLITHPSGDLLIDAGFGANLPDHIAMLARMERAPHHRLRTVAEQLDAADYDRSRLLGVLVTHVHWDHVSGLDGLRVPVWITKDELRYAADDPHGAVFRSVSADLPIHEYSMTGPPYLGFPASYDVHGDGSIVIAPAGGHTDGSVVVFVTPPDGGRFAFIGDLAWQLDAITRRVQRPWLMRRLADTNAELVRENLSRVIAVEGLLQIVPSHDLGAYRTIPPLPEHLPAIPRDAR